MEKLESQINIALENLKKAILAEMDEMSEKHRKTLRKLSDLQYVFITFDTTASIHNVTLSEKTAIELVNDWNEGEEDVDDRISYKKFELE